MRKETAGIKNPAVFVYSVKFVISQVMKEHPVLTDLPE